MRKLIYISIGTILFFAFITYGLGIRPVVYDLTEAQCRMEEGTVISIEESGTNDVLFTLEDADAKYFINRGLEKGLDLNKLRHQLVGQDITILYPPHWSLIRLPAYHAAKVTWQGKTLYSHLKEPPESEL